jgi:hypothetical protein
MKTVYAGEWVRVRNMMNRRFRADSPCELCGRFACTTVWYSLKTSRVRCLKCFDPPFRRGH